MSNTCYSSLFQVSVIPVMSGAVNPVSTCINTTRVLCTHAYYALSCLYCGLAPVRNEAISLDMTFSCVSKSLDACNLNFKPIT